MFTSDPISGRRNTISIDAGFGLGEALVSGLVTADLYQVRQGKITKKQVSQKKVEILPTADGGTVTRDILPERQTLQALDDEKIVSLASIGEKIRDYYGSEQDIEWCLEGDKFYIVQSRPITSLYPLPEIPDDKIRILFSFGHVQMMTEAMKPLGISVIRTIFPFIKDSPEEESKMLLEAGGRLYVDLSPVLQYKQLARVVSVIMPNADVSIASALMEYMERQEFKDAFPGRSSGFTHVRSAAPMLFSYCSAGSKTE